MVNGKQINERSFLSIFLQINIFRFVYQILKIDLKELNVLSY